MNEKQKRNRISIESEMLVTLYNIAAWAVLARSTVPPRWVEAQSWLWKQMQNARKRGARI